MMRSNNNSSATTSRHGPGPIDDLLDRPLASESAVSIDGVVVGQLIALHANTAVVNYPDSPGGTALDARVAAPVQPGNVGSDVVLAFERGNPTKPIIVGVLQQPTPPEPEVEVELDRADESQTLHVDGERVTLRADRELVLQCGKASITLTRAGKILIRGAYVLSRSSGANRIKGGSVQIN